jgi:Holliday junction resolvasome RuvABC endonuclease subunit
MTLLCLDIAFENIGWSVFKDGFPLAVGLIHADKSGKKTVRVADERADRCASMTGDLVEVIMKHRIQGVIGKLPAGSQNAAAANLCGWASGMVVSVCRILDLPSEWVSQGDVKKATVGRINATREEIMEKVSSLYRWDVKHKIIHMTKGKRAGKDTMQSTYHCFGKEFPAGKFEHIADSCGVYWASKHRKLVTLFG